MENKRGLSAIVATLIIVLLVLVAVGIIWVVIRNVIEEGTEQVDISTKCLAVDVRSVSVIPVSGEIGNYSVTLNRLAGGEAIEGIKVVLFNDTINSGVLDGFLTLIELETRTEKFDSAITNANKLEFTVYFKDSSGAEKLCSQTSTYNF